MSFASPECLPNLSQHCHPSEILSVFVKLFFFQTTIIIQFFLILRSLIESVGEHMIEVAANGYSVKLSVKSALYGLLPFVVSAVSMS